MKTLPLPTREEIARTGRPIRQDFNYEVWAWKGLVISAGWDSNNPGWVVWHNTGYDMGAQLDAARRYLSSSAFQEERDALPAGHLERLRWVLDETGRCVKACRVFLKKPRKPRWEPSGNEPQGWVTLTSAAVKKYGKRWEGQIMHIESVRPVYGPNLPDEGAFEYQLIDDDGEPFFALEDELQEVLPEA